MGKREKVYNDIEKSTYQFVYNDLVFFFSSLFYLNNFKERVGKYVENEILKFKNRYKVTNYSFLVNLEKIFIISFYKQVEKRGFKCYFYDNKDLVRIKF